jgi:hypothetical protein
VHCEPEWNSEKDNFAIYNTGVSLAKIVAILWCNKYSAKASSSTTLIRLHYTVQLVQEVMQRKRVYKKGGKMLIHDRYNIPGSSSCLFIVVRGYLKPRFFRSPGVSYCGSADLGPGHRGMVVHGLYGLSGSHISQSSDRTSDMRPDSLSSCGKTDSASSDTVLVESVL